VADTGSSSAAEAHGHDSLRSSRGAQAFVELLRLLIVLALTGVGYAVGTGVDATLGIGEPESTRAATSVFGALVGYILGGVAGRALVRQADSAVARLQLVPAISLIAAGLGAGVGVFVGLALLLPALLLPFQRFTVPLALSVVLVLAYGGGRLGAARGPDLGRYVGVRGRLEVSTPSRGGGVKVVDASALVDARLVEVARSGFLEGTLVIPRFVLEEVQRIADSGAPHRRQTGQRGLRAVQALKDEGIVALEISDDDLPEVREVDAKLAALARERRAALITCDANLAAVAEVTGVRVLNPHVLADAVRPPLIPGDQVGLRLVKPGRESGQAVGYLDDGTMVVVERADDRLGEDVHAEVTSIMQNRQGRMLFAVVADAD
jgi:uncharacterized protein YacL